MLSLKSLTRRRLLAFERIRMRSASPGIIIIMPASGSDGEAAVVAVVEEAGDWVTLRRPTLPSDTDVAECRESLRPAGVGGAVSRPGVIAPLPPSPPAPPSMAVAVAALVICPARYAYGCVWGFVIRLLLLILGYFLWGGPSTLAPTHRGTSHAHTTPSLAAHFPPTIGRGSAMWALLTSLAKYHWASH